MIIRQRADTAYFSKKPDNPKKTGCPVYAVTLYYDFMKSFVILCIR